MNPFRFSLNRKRFTSSDLHFSATAQSLRIHVILKDSRVVCSLLNEFQQSVGRHARAFSLGSR